MKQKVRLSTFSIMQSGIVMIILLCGLCFSNSTSSIITISATIIGLCALVADSTAFPFVGLLGVTVGICPLSTIPTGDFLFLSCHAKISLLWIYAITSLLCTLSPCCAHISTIRPVNFRILPMEWKDSIILNRVGI
jgi:hypothetical protein